MIVAAVVCPAAPLLVPRLSDWLLAQVPDLQAACLRALDVLRGVDEVVIVAAGPADATGLVLSPGDTVSAAGMARSDLPVVRSVRLPDGRAATGPGAAASLRVIDGGASPSPFTPAVGTMVGAYLLDAAGITPPARALQVAGGLVPPLEPQRRTGLLVMADGAACHGDHAPGAADPRSEPFDADLVTALRSGDPATLATTCARLAPVAPELRADTVPALAALAAFTADNGPAHAEVLHYSVPFGVGYWVATWRWG